MDNWITKRKRLKRTILPALETDFLNASRNCRDLIEEKIVMSGKDTRASGAGSIAVGGSAKSSTILTHVIASSDSKRSEPSSKGGGKSFVAEGPGSVVGNNFENTYVSTNVSILSAPQDRADAVHFPRLETPVDVILRIAHAGSEIRFDALTRDERRVGPFKKSVGTHPEEFAKELSEIGRGVLPSEEQRAGRLRNIGLDIAALIPKELLDGNDAVLRAALTKKGAGPSILILTDDAFIPWELALLPAGGGGAGRRYLGEAARVGRWPINDDFAAPRAGLELGDFHVVVASSYETTGSRRDLPHAIAEAEFAVTKFGAMRHEANGAEIAEWLASPRPNAETLLLALHGYSDPRANEQRLILGDGHEMTPADLLGLDGKDRPPRPYSVVFINACQAGTGGQTLGQVSGFPGTLTRRGTGAVIAPLWEVDDAGACHFARCFFTKMLDEAMEAGVALKSLRQDAASPGITRLAYIFYGHPLLKLNQD
ncbi:CHAT domain-containing protein [Bradyrhizobium sp. 197]|uniref:CHAT domain-containing protein n=1 Tax=Bradyrhizobium sp. 197 TaxID=2782663 RepID=UPI001FF91389|nr:CHAT domain-containing protein [Bradyrhizobium sp. 197]MCK1480745.1 CHAT domain-containing protein [Bradyrhizobium sp. 197]